MTRDLVSAPLRLDRLELVRKLRLALDRGDYCAERIRERLAIDELLDFREKGAPLLWVRTAGGEPLDALIRLFLVGTFPVDRAAAERALEPLGVAGAVELGLLEIAGDGVAALVEIRPHEGMLAAADARWRYPDAVPAHYVSGINHSSLRLANLTHRRRVASFLDLGTGCGIQSLLAARQCRRITATDVGPRAVNLAAFNAQLNEMRETECLCGDMFQPVAGRTFDLIVSNPPFVISPESRYVYRDGGMSGDRFSETVLRRAPEHLNEGGFCQVLCNWAHVAGESWRERVGGWCSGAGCDAWVLRGKTLDLADYAASWLGQTESGAPARMRDRLQEWLDYYARERIEAISYGFITLRKRASAKNWLRIDDAPDDIGPAGNDIALGFELYDFLAAARNDERLLATKLRPAPQLRLQQELNVEPGDRWGTTSMRLQLMRGLAYSLRVDLPAATLVAHCRADRTLSEVLVELSKMSGQSVAQIAAGSLQLVRTLIERGLLLPEGVPTAA